MDLRLWIGCLILGQLIFFQNCGQLESTSNDIRSQNSPPEVIDNFGITKKVRFFPNAAQTASENSEKGRYLLDLDNGTIEDLDSGDQLCTTTNELNLIQNLFDENDICDFINDPQPGQSCIQIFVPPYATLINESGDELPLGQKTSGCSGSINFCQIQTDQIVEAFQEVLDSATSGSCN